MYLVLQKWEGMDFCGMFEEDTTLEGGVRLVLQMNHEPKGMPMAHLTRQDRCKTEHMVTEGELTYEVPKQLEYLKKGKRGSILIVVQARKESNRIKRTLGPSIQRYIHHIEKKTTV